MRRPQPSTRAGRALRAGRAGRVGGWWASRSLRLRLTVVSTTVLAVGLGGGSAALAVLFYHQRVSAVDDNNRTESATLTALLRSGQLPDPLPLPSGQPVVAQVVEPQGTVRAATLTASRVVPMLPPRVLREHVSAGPFTADDSAMGPGPLRVMVVPARLDGRPVLVVSAVSFGDVGDTLGALYRVLAVAVPMFLVAAGIATWLAVGSALGPVDRLREAAETVVPERGAEGPRLPVPPSGDELERLAVTLNRMLDRLSAAAEQQRSFVADAAHELRSPIAAIRTQLEVALTTPTQEGEWRQVVTEVLQDVERIGRLADDMLLLARLDAGAPSRRSIVDVGELLGLTPSGVLVDADPVALHRGYDNLVANARRHARSAYTATLETRDALVVVTVDDDGPGIPEDQRERVFERWVRLDEARAQDSGGAGLGLAIARSVARSLGGEVTVATSPLGGLRAILTLPVAKP